jgi:Family of unknown function (DUF5694)
MRHKDVQTRKPCVSSILLLGLVMILVLASNSYSQQDNAQVMILGVYHFDNPNLDYVKTNIDDHLSPIRQKQIAEVVDLLAKFKPTKIVLEAVDGVSSINRNYEGYLKSDYVLKADERDQLGLRLARLLGHKQVYSADHKLDMDFGSVIAAAQQSQDGNFLQAFQQVMAELQAFEKRKATMTVREILAVMNDPKEITRGRDLYLQMAAVRSGEKFVGADVLAGWYQRNFRIFSNITRIIQPQDRVLVIFGQGHAAILKELVRSSPKLQLVEASDYLVRR